MELFGRQEKSGEEPLFTRDQALADQSFVETLGVELDRAAALPSKELERRYAEFRESKEKERAARREEIQRIKEELKKLYE